MQDTELVTPPTSSRPLPARPQALLRHAGVRQFVKFCIVGASSFTIDFTISYILTFHFMLWWVLAKTISFFLAVTNGFYWNRRWTFSGKGRSDKQQYMQFVAVNIVGWSLNIGIMKTVFFLATGTWRGQHPSKPLWLAATLTAMSIVVFWNFFANKHWTFKKH
ncbi:MAG TPA: GtrA family protein [Abditibacteriaceae bacterium]|nr:GtrA family protein [Abditibacteriaceae bacterium]